MKYRAPRLRVQPHPAPVGTGQVDDRDGGGTLGVREGRLQLFGDARRHTLVCLGFARRAPVKRRPSLWEKAALVLGRISTVAVKRLCASDVEAEVLCVGAVGGVRGSPVAHLFAALLAVVKAPNGAAKVVALVAPAEISAAVFVALVEDPADSDTLVLPAKFGRVHVGVVDVLIREVSRR